MYRLILYNVIYVAVFSLWLATGYCLKFTKRKEEEDANKTLNTSKSTNKSGGKPNPINYEPDAAALERERRRKIVENRVRMRKKREKQIAKTKEEPKEPAEATKKTKEEKLLAEEPTQASNSAESLEKSKSDEKSQEKSAEQLEKDGKVVEKTAIEEKQQQDLKKSEDAAKLTRSTSTSSEELGDVQLVDHDPYAAAKKHIIKKRAQELARRKQQEDAIRKRQERESLINTVSPDDTLKNISSIQYESQLSLIKRKKRLKNSKDGSSESVESGGTAVEPKSNELYIRDVPERVME
ncbi:hypothetical protein CRE_28921 [Caenorhabditis remanei]|uniref:Uncharacterized protein n=1 Tax=Caenorhabditis remanei TaxID=31234 RepID=E3MXI0_CAERE|nr:hypothetical protein CRE_28921 [Caenorhabditis remanei]